MVQSPIRKKQAGLTLVEALVVLAIFGGIAAVVAVIGPGLVADATVRGEAQAINSIATNTQSVYESEQSFDGLDLPGTSDAVNQAVFPDNLLFGNDVYNNWDGPVTVQAKGGGDRPREFEVSWPDVPQSDCVNLATHNGHGAREVDNGSGQAANTVSEAGNACNDDEVDLVFTFGKG